MSAENVEIARTVLERFNRDRGFDEEQFDPAVEIMNFSDAPIRGPYIGPEGLRQWRDEILEVVEDAWFEIEDLTGADAAGAVVFQVRLCGHARHTGLELDVPFSITAWFRDGRIHRAQSYTARSEALEAAGLSE